MIKAGLTPDKKTLNQYYHPLPDGILRDSGLSHYHLSATFTEEGWTSLSMKIGEKPRILVSYVRNIDVTNIIPKDFANSMEVTKKITMGEIPSEIRARINMEPFPLLESEIGLAKQALDVQPHVNIVSLYKSKNERITVEWRVSLYGPERVRRFTERIGFLPGSEAERKFEKTWETYEENKDKKLSRKDIKNIRKKLKEI